jgi:hypothetical protein
MACLMCTANNSSSAHMPFYPSIFSHLCSWVATVGTFLSTLMERVMTTSSTSNMGFFPGKPAH